MGDMADELIAQGEDDFYNYHEDPFGLEPFDDCEPGYYTRGLNSVRSVVPVMYDGYETKASGCYGTGIKIVNTSVA